MQAPKNKTPAPIQITAEQILREAAERQAAEPKPPKQKITDPEELKEYQMRKRKGYEDSVRKNRSLISNWLKYASWEESQKDLTRARSVYERAIDEDYRNPQLWIKYAEMEMRNKNVNSARNIWDRAVTLLPRVASLWYKYTYMEDVLGNFTGARQVFERWMKWAPDEHAWNSYIKFEMRLGEYSRARSVFERYVIVHPLIKTWIKSAKFEQKLGEIDRARGVFERAIQYLGEDANDERLFIAFAKFEEQAKEYDRARVIYKYALDHIPKQNAQDLFETFTRFEKQFGERDGIEDVILGKRRFEYEEEIKNNPSNYDVWFDYVRLEEEAGRDVHRTREVYERAIANIPPSNEKRFWRRYIYLWINYALYEELQTKDMQKAREVYSQCVKVIPHKLFSFTKIWIMWASFEIRQKDLAATRIVYGNAIGHCHKKEKIYKAYIQLEESMGEFERCRTLYNNFVKWAPQSCYAWIHFAKLEHTLGEIERARAIFELAIGQSVLDTPELLWKEYIDMEIDEGEHDRVRKLFRDLLVRTQHYKVWLTFAQFEASVGNTENARNVYDEAYKSLKNSESKEERAMLVENWAKWEEEIGDDEAIKNVRQKIPKRIIKRRPSQTAEGVVEEYYDYIFSDEKSTTGLSILEKAHKWKKQKMQES